MRRAAFAALLLAGAQGAAAQGYEIPYNANWYLSKNNGQGLGAELNAGLVKQDAEALMLAGWLHERGACVAKDIDKAFAYYERAHGKGEKLAALMLTGLAATTDGGADVVSVMWWARHTPILLQDGTLSDCKPLAGIASPTPEQLVAELKSWSQDRLEACRGRIGVSALLMSEAQYPMEAVRKDQSGTVLIEYDLQEGTLEARVPTGDARILVDHVKKVGSRALARLPKTQRSVKGQIEWVFTIK